MINSAEYPFAPGQPFPSKTPHSSQDYLDAALRAERYIDKHRKQTDDGIYWTGTQNVGSDLSLYSGSAGIAYLYLELGKILQNQSFKETAHQAGRYLAKHWHDLTSGNVLIEGLQPGLGYHMGVAGVGTVLVLLEREFHDPLFSQALTEIGDYLKDEARHDEHGAYWNEDATIILDGGIILFLLQLFDLQQEPRIGQLIREAGNHVLSTGRKESAGTSFDRNMWSHIGDFRLPNFEIGTAGVAYTLVKLYEFTHDDQYLASARSAVDYLRDIAVPQRKGYLIPLRIESDGTLFKGNSDSHDPKGDASDDHGTLPLTFTDPIFYLGACHGPAGTARLFYELDRATDGNDYADDIDQLVDGLESLGAPELQSAGLWNAVHFCCGHAGLVQFFIGLYEGTGNQRWLDLAHRAGRVLLGTEEQLPDGTSDWPVAWERVHPDRFSRATGYYDGAAGIAASLLQLYLTDNNAFAWDRIADDPFPEHSDLEHPSK